MESDGCAKFILFPPSATIFLLLFLAEVKHLKQKGFPLLLGLQIKGTAKKSQHAGLKFQTNYRKQKLKYSFSTI
ncbi:hypothetical protein [Pedobacter suwonensis]|uniref:hypothetical protein n=1 Tax=Pedobacter suwonensis TaxID=332999 RepID=UPI0038292632